MPRRKYVFYAFPSYPASLGETILQAISELQKLPAIRRSGVKFRPWPEVRNTGKHLISTIQQSIDRADIFACDLTYPNSNVTFELGYAIGRFKRIWVSLDSSVDGSERRFKRMYYNLLGLGYATYENHQDLANAFDLDSPLADLEQTLLGQIYRDSFPRQEQPTIFYVKSAITSDAVIATEELLSKSVFANSIIRDDPKENPSPTLDWYAKNTKTADAVLVDLLSSEHNGAQEHNAKCSVIAGLALGFGKPILMSAHTPFEAPVDYQQILSSHDTAEQCGVNVRQWINQLEPNLPRRRARRVETSNQQGRSKLDIRRLAIGEPVAENERQQLDEYFVETSAYFRALEGPTTIIVGRRGTGKSAILFAIYEALSRDRRNHVCIIKPVGYEVDGLVRILEEIIQKSERGYLIESLWKFLIYTELARSVHQLLSMLPPQQPPSEEESKFIKFFEDHQDIIDQPFSERLNRVVTSLIGIGDEEEATNQRTRISEKLHSNLLRDLREHLGLVLTRHDKVTILIDNLDEPWGPGHHLSYLSELIWGLLGVTDAIAQEFQHEDYWRKAVNICIAVFLRSDIFAFIQPLAAEQDKLPIQRIIWDEPELLSRVLNQRLVYSIPKDYFAEDVWDALFPSEVVGIPTREFIINSILPRPRDVIFLIREAIDRAVNLGHASVREEDLLTARGNYSEYILNSVLAEDDPSKGKLELVLYEFAGCSKFMKRSEVEDRISRAGVSSEDVDFYLDLLCDVSFLGIESINGFKYPRHESERRMLRLVAESKASQREDSEELFQVNAAFWQVLQIE